MKWLLFAALLLSVLHDSAFAMEAVPDNDVAKPKGLLSCCVSGQKESTTKRGARKPSAHAESINNGTQYHREDGKCPGCTVDAVAAEEEVTRKRMLVHNQQANSAVSKAIATTALFHGVVNNNLTCMLRHLSEGADVNAKDEIGWASIEYAIRDRNTEVAAILLAVEGIDVTSVTTRGDTLDQLLAKQKHSATVNQQQSCDEIQLYLDAKRAGVFPYSVQGHRLINTADKQMLLSALSMDGARLQGRSPVELTLVLTNLIQDKKPRETTQVVSETLKHE